MNTIDTIVKPALADKPLAAYLDLITVVSQLAETITFTKTIPPDDSKTAAVSRRSLFTGEFLDPAPPPPETMEVTRKRPLHPAIRDGLIRLLLTAEAQHQSCTVAELIADLYRQQRPFHPVPLHVDLSDQFASEPALFSQITSMGYTTTTTDHKEALGANGEKVQAQVRRLTDWLQSNQYDDVTIHLRLRGGYGKIYENNLGRILGTLYGLVQAARPYAVRIEDPFILESRDEQIKAFTQLQEFIRIRKLSVSLAAHAWVNSVEAVKAFIATDVVQMLHVDAEQFVSLPAAWEALVCCQKQKMATLWQHRLPSIAAHTALALQPDVIMAGGATTAAPIFNEMKQTHAWLTYQNNSG